MASPSARDVDWAAENQPQDVGPAPAFTEAQHWIEQVTGRSFGDKDFRTGLENGILLCELLNAIKPGAVKKINRLPTPIAGLDNITLFLRACEELGLKGSQLFDPGDLQDVTNRATIKVSEFSRKMKNVLITIYWLGKTANSCTSYNGPTLNLKEFEGLLSLIQKELEDTDSPKRSIRDSGYIDSWDSERSDSLSPPRHTRDDSFDSLDSFGSRSQQTPSPEVILRGSSDGRGSDSESDITQKAPDVKRDDMSVRRASGSEPKSSLPFNQYLPNKSNHTAYMPAPLRKKRAERGENYRKSWSNTTSPVGAERPFSHSHPETIEEEQNEESCQDEDFAERQSTFFKVQGIDDSKTAEKCEPAPIGDADGLKTQLHVCVMEDQGHRASIEGAKWERKNEEEIKKLKRIQKAGITVMSASKRYCREKQQGENCGQTTPDIILRRENTFLTNYQDSESESEEEQKVPDIEKDDLALRKAQMHQPKSKISVNQFLPGPCTKKDRERWQSIKQSTYKAAGASQSKEQKMDSQSHIEVTEGEVVVPQKASVLLKSQQQNEPEAEEQLKAPAIERDDLARRKVLGGFTSRQSSHTFIHSSITSADMEIWQRLKLSTDTSSSSEETSKPIRNCSEMKPMSESEIERAAQDDLACRKARSNRSASGSCQRFVHFGPVTEIDQQRWEKLSIAGAAQDSESEEGEDSCTIKAYTCHLLPSVASAVMLNSQDSIIRGESQVISGSEVSLHSQIELSCKPEEIFLSDTCTAEYFRSTPSPVLAVQTITLSESSHDSSEEVEDEEKRAPDREKDDMMSRRIKATSMQSSAVFNKFLPAPSSQQGQSGSGINDGCEKAAKKMNKPEEESPWTYSPTDALSDDTGSVSMNDMRPEEDVSNQPHSKTRHEELHNIHSRLREEQDKWQDDLARWKSRRRSASQDLIKRKEERDIVEKVMSGEPISERRKSIKTYREIVEEKECREHALQEAYKEASTPEEAEDILKKFSQRFIISEPVLESLVMPKFLERSQSVDSDTPSSPTKDPNSLKYLRQQSLPVQKYTATVEAIIIPSSQSQTNFSATITSPTRSVASKAVPMLTPKPYSQPKDSQTVLKSFKKDGKIRINGGTSPTFTRVEDKEYTPAVSSPTLTKSQMFESIAKVDNPPLKSQTDTYSHVPGLEQVVSSTINDRQTEETVQEEQIEMSITIPTCQGPSTEEESDLKSCCNESAEETVKDAAQEEDHHWNVETSTVHISLSNSVAQGTKNTVDSKLLTIDGACLKPEKEEPSESAQEQLKQEKISRVEEETVEEETVEEETVEGSQPADAINQPEVKSNENTHIPVAPLNLPKRFDRWYWDPEEERKRQERWQKEQERLLQERYRREQEKLRLEWEKAQREVEEDERRYHEEECKIIQETVAPLTPRSPALSIHLPNEWISPAKTEENRNSEPLDGPSSDGENKLVKLQTQTNLVETESWQAEGKGRMQEEEEQQWQKGGQQKLTWEQKETLGFKKDEDGQQENRDETEKNKLEKWHWQETKQLGSEEQRLNLQSEIDIFQMDKEAVSESQNQTDWQTPSSGHQQLPAQAARSPVITGRSWNTQEFPSFLEVQRKQQQGVQDGLKTGSLDRNWALQSGMMDRKKWSGSHENLQSGQSLPLPHSSPLPLQSPSRSVSGKKLCTTCGLPLGKGAAMIIETLSLYFHIQCFTCGICQGQLGDATTGTDVRIRNGLLNCNDCYIRSRTAGQPTTL